jgi:hypothetical protein
MSQPTVSPSSRSALLSRSRPPLAAVVSTLTSIAHTTLRNACLPASRRRAEGWRGTRRVPRGRGCPVRPPSTCWLPSSPPAAGRTSLRGWRRSAHSSRTTFAAAPLKRNNQQLHGIAKPFNCPQRFAGFFRRSPERIDIPVVGPVGAVERRGRWGPACCPRPDPPAAFQGLRAACGRRCLPSTGVSSADRQLP